MKRYNEIYNKIVKGGYDFGTGSWAYIDENINMQLDEYGEYIPILEEGKEISEKNLDKIIKATLSLEDSLDESVISEKIFSNIKNIKHNEYIGYYLELYAGFVLEGKFRENGSSGGLCTWILKELLEQKLIDGVIHVKNSSEEGLLFDYQISRSVEELQEGAKTKYYPVEYSKVLKEVKNLPGKYAIVGVPSFIMSYHLLAEIDEKLKEKIVFTIGLVCGHQKSSKFAEYLAWQCGIEPGSLEDINFRKKISTDTSDDYSIEVKGNVGNKDISVTKKMSELKGKDWGQGYFKISASDYTDDVMNETADITFGDAWLPEYTNDYMGTNIVIVRNPIILKILQEGIHEKKIKLDVLDENKIIESQKSHYRHTIEELPYRLFKLKKQNKWYPNKRVKAHNQISFNRRKVQDIRERIRDTSKYEYLEATSRNDIDYFNEKMDYLVHRYNRIYKIDHIRKLGFVGIFNKVIEKITK